MLEKVLLKVIVRVLLEGAVILLACIIFSLFASTPPVIDVNAAVNQVWSYIGQLVFNMLILVGVVKMSDRIIREMMGL